ncbi:hypothetical protein [Psychrobacter sp. I-STPA6b]|uniref:hypothetical protein n=1 Tax=Psychrobacter sp. I-STPA6b TaxID=2585718 RepID=UPI001D0CC420|nr:hypothetical protein [Psychrobacter sp. I-STPA6b]
MKLLLVGFSEQNAEAVKMFCSRNFASLDTHVIPRQLSEQMTLILPNNSSQQQNQADAFLVDLEGVGMSYHTAENQEALAAFINAKPTVLISRRDMSSWRQMEKVVQSVLLYLCAPYSKTEMMEVVGQLTQLLSKPDRTDGALVVQSEKTSQKQSLSLPVSSQSATREQTRDKKLAEVDGDKSTEASTVPAMSSKVQEDNSIIQSQASDLVDGQSSHFVKDSVDPGVKVQVLTKVLKQYFSSIYDTVFVRSVLELFSYTHPLIMRIGKYELLINPAERSVIMDSDITRVTDCFCIIGNQKYAGTNGVQLLPISTEQYIEKSQKLSRAGNKKYVMNTILWQIAAEVLHYDLPNQPHPLRLKVKFVPNFAVMRFVPSYVYSVLSACLSKARTIVELQSLFPELSIQQLNRVILLSMLSGVAEETILLPANTTPDADKSTLSSADKMNRNSGVRQANSTGFFRRLLQKLSI